MSLNAHLLAIELIYWPYEVAVRAAQLIIDMATSHSWLAEREDEILAIVSTDIALLPNTPSTLTSNMNLVRELCRLMVTPRPHELTDTGIKFTELFIQLVEDRIHEIEIVRKSEYLVNYDPLNSTIGSTSTLAFSYFSFTSCVLARWAATREITATSYSKQCSNTVR